MFRVYGCLGLEEFCFFVDLFFFLGGGGLGCLKCCFLLVVLVFKGSFHDFPKITTRGTITLRVHVPKYYILWP